VESCKAKKGFRCVESDEIREVTPIRQNCNQTQLKGLNIKRAISVNMDVFNRRFLTQFPKIALDYDVDWNRYCRTRKFYCSLGCIETYLHSVQNTYIFYIGPKFTGCFVFRVGTLLYQE
jgi:hypothetical protein